MVNFKEILLGNAFFFIAYGFIAVTQYIIPTMVDYLDNTLGGIVWVGTIMLWFLGLIVVPTGLMVHGLIRSDEGSNKVFDATMGIIYFIFALAFTYFSYYMITPLAGVLTLDFLVVLFWIGLVLIWVCNVFVVPSYLIIKAKSG